MQVQEDIIKTLKLYNPVHLLSSFDRPNIFFDVRPVDSHKDVGVEIAKELLGGRTEHGVPSTICYVLKRVTADSIATTLQSHGRLRCIFSSSGSQNAELTNLCFPPNYHRLPHQVLEPIAGANIVGL